MAKILIIGSGVMGSALTVPASDNGHTVTLVGTPLDRDIIESLRATHTHPKLAVQLPNSITPIHCDDLTTELVNQHDVLIVGVSSKGIDWLRGELQRVGAVPPIVALVTKGLEPNNDNKPLTYAQTLPKLLSSLATGACDLVGIGGPCIAREIALRQPTATVYASSSVLARTNLAKIMATPVYRIDLSHDVQGVEVCAALKNFLTIGVSSTIGPFTMTKDGHRQVAKNPTAAVFNQAIRELAQLCEWMGGDRDTAFDLAGLGDLHVTVGGGRNSRLGVLLGEGQTIQGALNGALAGETVEGVDTGHVLAASFYAQLNKGRFSASTLPLTHAVLESITKDTPFTFNFEQLALNAR